MPTLSLMTHFTVSIDDDDAHIVAGGSTTTADTFTINYYDDKRITVADAGLVTLWNDDSTVSNFDFLWIDSRNMGNMDGTFGESQHQDEIDNWQTHWAADTIDRIECYNGTGGAAKVRCFVAT